MVKKVLIYLIIFFLAMFISFTFIIFNIMNKIERKINAEFSNITFTKQVEKTQEDLLNIKNLLRNYYQFLKKHYYQKKESETIHTFKTIQNFYDILNNLNIKSKNIFLNQLILKNQINAKIIDINHQIIASKNILEIGKKYTLPCNPLDNYGLCKIKKENIIYIVKYLPDNKIFVVSHFKDKIKATDTLINILKSFDNLIIVKNNHILKNKFDKNSFYVFEYFKPINVFFGKRISYKSLQQAKIFIDEFNSQLKKIFLKTFILFLWLIILIFIGFIIFFDKKLNLIDKYFESIKKSSFIDNLTKLYNRKYLEELDVENKTFAIIDLDNFKYINDTFGHKVGDEILIYISNLLKEYFKNDIIIRWGGDEFILISNKSADEIKKIIEILNTLIEKYQQKFDKNLSKKLSLSAGICESSLPYEKKFKNADLALYKVKKTKKGKALIYKEIDYIKIY